jgi:hypothetical protein
VTPLSRRILTFPKELYRDDEDPSLSLGTTTSRAGVRVMVVVVGAAVT